MPFKSKAQRRKFAELLVEGKITPEAYEEWNRSTGGKELPERVKPKSKRSVKTRKRTKTKRDKTEAPGQVQAKAPRKTGK
jgi:hypothetical protein